MESYMVSSFDLSENGDSWEDSKELIWEHESSVDESAEEVTV